MLEYLPYIPEFITVHLGAPNQNAQNVTVSFPDYIKNVASSEIFPTWNESALRANILAQVSYALNRVYLEYYRSRGYDFDITNSTAIDQKYIYGRNIFDNIDRLVSEMFNDYIRRRGQIEPLATKYCNGTTTTCDGMSQWGSQMLAEEGLNSLEILRTYYGEDIELVIDEQIQNISESYPGTALRIGSNGEPVRFMQIALNRISQNYPLINKIASVDGIFGEITENAVKTFQGIFNLTPDGIIGRATWYEIVRLYVGIRRLSELDSEGIRIFNSSLEYPDAIEEGNVGEKVVILQYFLSVMAEIYPSIQFVNITGVFEERTKNSVISFQRQFGLPETGIVNDETWNEMYNTVMGIINNVFYEGNIFPINTEPFPGETLVPGSTGDSVVSLQDYLLAISLVYTEIPAPEASGIYGPQTEEAVRVFQSRFGLAETGDVDRQTWNEVINTYKDVFSAETSRPEQFPGANLKRGDRDQEESGDENRDDSNQGESGEERSGSDVQTESGDEN